MTLTNCSSAVLCRVPFESLVFTESKLKIILAEPRGSWAWPGQLPNDHRLPNRRPTPFHTDVVSRVSEIFFPFANTKKVFCHCGLPLRIPADIVGGVPITLLAALFLVLAVRERYWCSPLFSVVSEQIAHR